MTFIEALYKSFSENKPFTIFVSISALIGVVVVGYIFHKVIGLFSRIKITDKNGKTYSFMENNISAEQKREIIANIVTEESTQMDFIVELDELFSEAEKNGLTNLRINAGELHRRVGGYPGKNHRMPACCSAMRSEMNVSDRIIQSPPKGNGATLTIEYNLPR
jgi:5-methylcytosine-specific restriction protein A